MIQYMNELSSKKINELLNLYDLKDNMSSPKVTGDPRFEQLKLAFSDYAETLSADSYCVLGIDILGYSQLDFKKQAYIPVLFDLLLKETIRQALESEYLVFNKYKETSIRERFIPTGDGGFFLLESPFEGLLFALNFAAMLHLYNSHSFYPGIRYALDSVRVRYCLTFDKVYKYERNYYGPAIINNHRIMSRDKLDRCLLDANTQEWFLEKINGIESLRVFTLQDIINKLSYQVVKLPEGKNYYQSAIIVKDFRDGIVPSILNLATQKIGTVKAKQQSLDVYNLFMQLAKSYSDESNPILRDNYVINFGNLNTAGLSDEPYSK